MEKAQHETMIVNAVFSVLDRHVHTIFLKISVGLFGVFWIERTQRYVRYQKINNKINEKR